MWRITESNSMRMPPPPQSDGLAPDTIREGRLEDVNGILLRCVGYAIPANVALDPDELEARIELYALRAEREMASVPTRRKSKRNPLMKPNISLDLKLVNCASCGATLLGESQERRRKRIACARLYPPVAGRLFGGRPYCGGCFDELREESERWASFANTSSAGTTAAAKTS